MNEAARNDSELLNLLSAAWDNRLDAVSRARLEELLRQDDFAAIDHLTSLTRLHLDLEWLVSSNAAQDKAIASVQEVGASHGSARSLHRDWRILGLSGLAAAIVLWATYAWYVAPFGHEHLVRPPQAVGQMASLENAGWSDGTSFKVGDALLEGESFDLKKGFAQLSMGFGADILMRGPCRMQIVASDRVALERGQLAVRAAKWATGFSVDTEDLRATDLGTWFSVEAGDGPSEVHVIDGIVLAKPLAEESSTEPARRLTADEAIEVGRGAEMQPIKFRRDAAAQKLEGFRPLRPIEIWNTGVGLQVSAVDPHWQVTPGPNADGPFPRSAVVCDPHGSYGINEPQRSQWISVAGGTTSGVPARSTYTFETTFDLTGFDLNSVRIWGLVLADDGVDEVRLNGKKLSIAPWKDWGYGVVYTTFHPIEIRGRFIPGINRLAFAVKNETFIYRSDRGFDLPETPNPMALRTEWQAFGRPIADPSGD